MSGFRKFDAKATAKALIGRAEVIGEQFGSVVMVPFTREQVRPEAGVSRMTLGREQALDCELRSSGRGMVNTGGTCLVASDDGPRILSTMEAAELYKEAHIV